MQKWEVEDVKSWLIEMDIDQEIIKKFVDNDVNGQVLFELKEEDLDKYFGISSFGHWKMLMKNIETL